MSEPSYDFGPNETAEAPKSSDALVRLRAMAARQLAEMADVERLEAELRLAQQKLKQTSEHDLPQLMDELQMESFTTTDGFVVDIAETIRASIPEAHRAEGFAWLEANGSRSLIKSELKLTFGRDENEAAEALLKELNSRGLVPDYKRSVHPGTLSSLVRERLKDGKEVPFDILGVYQQRASRITDTRKEKKSKKAS